MNREILFRGKRTDGGEWVYGYPVGWQNEGGDISIVDSRFGACIDESGNLMMLEAPFVTKVAPSTVGQYTGLTDKNSVKIFEGDIVHLSCKEGEWDAVVTFGNPNGFYSWGWQLRPIKDTHFNEDILLWVETEDANVSCAVISNVYYGAQEAAQAGEGDNLWE